MPDDPQDLDRLRDHWHDLREAVAVIQERQKAQSDQLDRIETLTMAANGSLRHHTERLTILETRAADGRAAGAKWGAGFGAFVAAVIAGLMALWNDK